MVRAAGLEPARAFAQQIFIPTTVFTAAKRRLWAGLSLHHSFSALGAAHQVSTPSSA